MSSQKKNPHIGASLDDALAEFGIEEVRATAVKRTLALPIESETTQQNITKSEMARRMRTSAS